MASGKKNYFRHSFFARNDEFICSLIDKFGLPGYYYYFALLEMCGEQAADQPQESYRFHKRVLINNLRLNTRKLNLFLGYLQDKSKISYTYNENQYEIILPNLLKYLGRYSTKIDSNVSNKRKEKKRKEKESKVNKNKENSEFDFEVLYNLYPRKSGKKAGISKLSKVIKTEADYSRLQIALDNFIRLHKNTEQKFIKHFSTFANNWEDYFEVSEDEIPLTEEERDEIFKTNLEAMIERSKKDGKSVRIFQ